MKKLLFLFLICLVVSMLVSCASIFSGSTDKVMVQSEPSGALVSVNGIPSGRTPVELELEKGKSHNIVVSHDGYETGYAVLSNRIGAGWIILDIIAGLVPLIIDAATGSWYGISPDSVYLVLNPVPLD